MNGIRVIAPGSPEELVEGLGELSPQSRILAGGTDLIIALHKGNVRPDILLDLSGLPDWGNIRREADRVVIGANTTFARLSADKIAMAEAPCLVEAARAVGSAQIRNQATLGGNIGTASPAGDALPPLLALGADVGLLNARNEFRRVPLDGILTGPYQTSLAHDEVMVDIGFAAASSHRFGVFVKIGARSTVTIARLSLAVTVDRDERNGSTILSAGVALGAAGQTAFRVPELERVLLESGKSGSWETRFVDGLIAQIDRSIAGRPSLAYKRKAAAGLAHQALQRLGLTRISA